MVWVCPLRQRLTAQKVRLSLDERDTTDQDNQGIGNVHISSSVRVVVGAPPWRLPRQIAVSPPSMRTSTPVMNAASSDARNAARPAMSSATPTRSVSSWLITASSAPGM